MPIIVCKFYPTWNPGAVLTMFHSGVCHSRGANTFLCRERRINENGMFCNCFKTEEYGHSGIPIEACMTEVRVWRV